jgi:mono/diheme cytochrome c family protein
MMTRTFSLLSSGALALAIAACGGSTQEATPETAHDVSGPAAPPAGGEMAAPADQTAAPATFAEQVALGQTLYAANCAECHGASGEGGKAPRLVGLADGALPLDPPAGAKFRTGQFETVADVATFVAQNMPPNKGGSLTEEEYFAILAFDLKANGIDLEQKLDAALAATLTIPRE